MYHFKTRVRYSELDQTGHLSLEKMMEYFQDTTIFHSEDLGAGLDSMAKKKLVWLMSAWQIVVERMPNVGEMIDIGTAPYEFKGCFGSRNFLMQTEDGEVLARANSIWTLASTETFMPAKITPEIASAYTLEERLDMEYAGRKIAVNGQGTKAASFEVKKYHLDTNNHVNNCQYISMACEYIPSDFTVKMLRAEYKMSAKLGDIITPEIIQEENKIIIRLLGKDDKPYTIVEFTQ